MLNEVSMWGRHIRSRPMYRGSEPRKRSLATLDWNDRMRIGRRHVRTNHSVDCMAANRLLIRKRSGLYFHHVYWPTTTYEFACGGSRHKKSRRDYAKDGIYIWQKSVLSIQRMLVATIRVWSSHLSKRTESFTGRW